MLDKPQTTAIVFLAGLALAVQVFLERGIMPSPAWLGYISPAVAAILIALAGFERFAWRWPGVRHVLARSRPDLRGTWKGSIASSWVNPETNEPLAPIEAFLVVRQTFSTLSLRLLSAESASESSAAEVVRAADKTCQVAWVYRNEPRQVVRPRSEIHYGGACVRVVNSDSPSNLEGHYWTDRSEAQTSGELRFLERVPELFESFADAQAGFRKGRRRSRGRVER